MCFSFSRGFGVLGFVYFFRSHKNRTRYVFRGTVCDFSNRLSSSTFCRCFGMAQNRLGMPQNISGFLCRLRLGFSMPYYRDPRLVLASLHRYYWGNAWGWALFGVSDATFCGLRNHHRWKQLHPTSKMGIHGSKYCLPSFCLLRIRTQGLKKS